MQKKKNNTALLIIDPQNDFCPGGKLPVTDGNQIIPVINALRSHFNTIVISQDWHPKGHVSFASSHEGKLPFDSIEVSYGTQTLWPDHCVQKTHGAEFHPELIVAATDLIIQKGTNKNIDSYSAFFENDQKTHPKFSDGQTLTEKLRALGITKLVIGGLAFDYCVGWTALDAVREGFDVTIIFNATRAIAPDSMHAMQKKLAHAGVHVISTF